LGRTSAIVLEARKSNALSPPRRKSRLLDVRKLPTEGSFYSGNGLILDNGISQQTHDGDALQSGASIHILFFGTITSYL
jgi:hypothetical protein